MIREIEFRGKRISDDQWIYGYLSESNEISNINEETMPREEVDEDSVGQWTGLYDCNNKKIYEGDVVECVSWNEYFTNHSTGQVMEPFRRKLYVAFVNGSFKLIEPMPFPMTDNRWDIIYNGDVKIIGNLVDNPELINKQS